MAFRGQFATFAPFSRGLFDSRNNIDIPSGFCTDTRNSRVHPNYCRKRDGMTAVGGVVEASTRVMGGAQYRTVANTLADAVAWNTVGAGRFYVNLNGVWTNRTGAVVLTTNDDARVHFVQFNDLLVGTDNVNSPFSWDGNTANNAGVLGGSPPNRCRFLATFGNRLLALNFTDSAGTAFPEGIAWSSLNNPNSWATTGTGFLRIQQRGNKPITGVGYLGDRLLVFFEDMIFELTETGNDLNPFEPSQFLTGYGTLAGYAVVSVDDDVFALSSRGPYSIGKSGKPRQLEEPVREFWSTVNYNDAATFSAAYSFKDRAIKFGVRTGTNTENDRTLIYRLDLNAWSIDDGYVADACWPARNALGEDTVYAASTDRVFELDRGTLDLVAATAANRDIAWYLVTPWWSPGESPMKRKQFFETQLHYLTSVGNTMTLEYQLALFSGFRPSVTMNLLNQGLAIWDEAVFDVDVWGESEQGQGRAQLDGDGTHIRFRVSNDQAPQVTFEGLTLAYKESASL